MLLSDVLLSVATACLETARKWQMKQAMQAQEAGFPGYVLHLWPSFPQVVRTEQRDSPLDWDADVKRIPGEEIKNQSTWKAKRERALIAHQTGSKPDS